MKIFGDQLDSLVMDKCERVLNNTTMFNDRPHKRAINGSRDILVIKLLSIAFHRAKHSCSSCDLLICFMSVKHHHLHSPSFILHYLHSSLFIFIIKGNRAMQGYDAPSHANRYHL